LSRKIKTLIVTAALTTSSVFHLAF
jgi:hypothetical protein